MEISISKELYERLASHATGFDTPESVIEKLLEAYESKTLAMKPVLDFIPDETTFKAQLIEKKMAWRVFEFYDGSFVTDIWQAANISSQSNLRANLWSGALRDWKKKNIKKLTLTTEPPQEHIAKDTARDSSTISIKVGAFVKEHLPRIIQYCSENESHIKLLSDKEWCADKFGIPFSFMLDTVSIKTQMLHERYWAAEHKIENEIYRFCSQFGGNSNVGTKTRSEYHGEKFIQYLNTYNLLLPKYKTSQIAFLATAK